MYSGCRDTQAPGDDGLRSVPKSSGQTPDNQDDGLHPVPKASTRASAAASSSASSSQAALPMHMVPEAKLVPRKRSAWADFNYEPDGGADDGDDYKDRDEDEHMPRIDRAPQDDQAPQNEHDFQECKEEN